MTVMTPNAWAWAIDDLGRWPASVYRMVLVLLFTGLLAIGYAAHLQDRLRDLAAIKRQANTLRAALEAQQRTLLDPDSFQAYLQALEARLNARLPQLPKRAAVATLVSDIAAIGRAHQLVIQSLSPAEQRPRAGYVALPIDMAVTGTYHRLGGFAYDIASLPRIVSLHDVTLTPAAPPDALTLSARAVIYWSAPGAVEQP